MLNKSKYDHMMVFRQCYWSIGYEVVQASGGALLNCKIRKTVLRIFTKKNNVSDYFVHMSGNI